MKSEVLNCLSLGVHNLKGHLLAEYDDNFLASKDAFADVTYYLLIWRRPKFFLFNYIQPAVLINILAL